MAERMGDANMTASQSGLYSTKRRSTRFVPEPHHSIVFKAFTRESLIERKKALKTKKFSVACLDPAKQRLEPDPYLASGQQLPPALVRQMPKELLGKPIEDIDPYYTDKETFVIISRGKELTRFSAAKALCLLGPFHPIRRVVLFILVNPVFNLLVILTILINCILMTIQGSETVEKTEIIFTIVYTTEMGLKVLARGFIMDDFTYLRDPWNWLDFAVIIMAYLTIVIQDLGNLSVMRTFRVLRALKTVAIIPGMKTIVGAVIDSVKNLKDVVVLTLFSLSVFSLLGLQIYMGQLTQKCILNGPNNMNDNDWFNWCSNSSHWIPEPDDEIFGAYRLCGNATGAQSCPEKHTCIQGFGPNPDYGFTNFDTFGWALICSFRLMTQDFWEGLYMQVLKTAGSWHIIFFIVSIFLGSIYLMNLILAIVAMSYNELQRRAEEEEEAAAEDEAAFLESCRLMELQEQLSDYSSSNQGRMSYRPSVEIGLVGQSILANLCQNGLSGYQLNRQMIIGAGAQSLRSQSLCVTNFVEPRDTFSNAKQSKRPSMNSNYQDPPMIASSMTELRRKSSVKTNESNSPPTGYRRSSRPRSQRLRVSSHHHVSSSALMGKRSQRSSRSSVTSDRDLSVLRQRAGMIKIVSDEYQSSDHGHTLGGKEIVRSLDFSKDLTSCSNSRLRVDSSASIEPIHQDINRLSIKSRKIRTKSHDYSTRESARDKGECAKDDYRRMSHFCSEAAICKQPVSIHSNPQKQSLLTLKRNSSLSPDSNSDSIESFKNQQKQNKRRDSSKSTRSNVYSPTKTIGSFETDPQQQQLGIERCFTQNQNMNRLSVENFQQFGLIRSNQQPQSMQLFEVDQQDQCYGQQTRGRLESKPTIHPNTMVRAPYARPRQSVALDPSQIRNRRISHDFSRRASDWSRMSMSTNTDLRRLLRLWSHTNPYQGRTRMNSVSNQSQMNPLDSTAPSIRTNSQYNSPHPSSIGSARQAYELISAASRRRSRFYSDARYPMPIDDDLMDKMSINMRDKCLAHCLNCLDILCIWECCGAWLRIQRIISLLVFDPFTELFIIFCILINTLFMALDSDDADAYMKSIFERGNYFFTATFAVEASMKIMALSPKFYFREGWNVFDSIIVGLSLLELGLEGVYGLSVLRSFRLLRVFKLAKSWPTLNLLISIMGKAVGDLGNLTFVLAIIVFIFAVMGMQLFGNKYVDHNFPSGELPRWNFTDFMHSFMIVFRILCAEWIEPMWDCLLVGGWPCIPFFLIAVTVGNLVVLNLFLALLLASFGASNLSSPQADNVDTKKLQEAIARFSRFGRWTCAKFAKTILWLTSCFLCRKQKDILSTVWSNGDDKDGQPVKSHIVAMSKLERLKNIEQRTEELKNKIRRSPEHHYHLRQLAQSQLRESIRKPSQSSVTTSGYNFNYKHKFNPDKIDNDTNSLLVSNIPIIVNEATDGDEDQDASSGKLDNSSIIKGSPALCISREIIEEFDDTDGDLCQSKSPNDSRESINLSSQECKTRYSNYFINMQPIREDSRDADSSTSSDIVDGIHNKSLDKLAQDELSYSSNLWKRRCAEECEIGENSRKSGNGEDEIALHERLIRPTIVTPDHSTIHYQLEDACKIVVEGEQADKKDVEEERPKSSLYLKAPKRQDMEEEDERALQHIETYIEKCICIGILCLKWFLFRQYVRKIVEHRYFDQCILVLIIISSVTLALEDKHLNDRPTLKSTLDVLDTIFTIIFSLEMIFKWLAFGMKRYFGNIWSWLDFVIVLVSLVNLMASIFGSGKIQALKTMRTLRAMRGLRPLRALQRFQGMRVVVNALIQAIPSIFNVLLVCLIFWLIFSIMGVQMFGGKFWRCINPETYKVVSPEEAANRHECIGRNFTWANPQINFDNVLNAYLALFQVATFKGWIDIMNSATDSRTRDDQPIREANIYMYFYFVFFVIFGSFFTLNLFIGVIIDNFNEQKKKTGGSLEIFMTDDQKKYYHAMKKMRSKRPIKAMTRPKLKLQAFMFDVTTSRKFDMAIMIIIGLNMFVMALEHYGQSQEFSIVLENLNLIFIAIFTLECLCKIFAMRHFYFREPWNVFDFIVVDLSILGVVMKEYVAKYFVSPTLLRVVRVVKVGRVLRLVKGAKGIRTLLFALAMSLPALFNICLLLFLVMFIYAIFGMSFFMNVRPRSGIDETFNFETFTSSIIVLFQMSTSAAWDMVLDPLMDEENDCQKPDPALGIEGTCGNKSIAIFYLISYVIVTFLIIINMYIAVILENYSQATEDVQEGLTDDDYEMYYEIWQKFDPDGTQYLPYEKLSDFVDALEDPLRIPKPNDLALVVLDINIYQGNQCYCVDILDSLTKFFFTRKGLVIQVNEQLQKVQSTLHETPFERITTTYLVKRQHYCATIIQNSWRRWRDRTKYSRSQRNEKVTGEE